MNTIPAKNGNNAINQSTPHILVKNPTLLFSFIEDAIRYLDSC